MNASELRVGNYVHGNPYDGVIRVFNNGKCVIKHKSGSVKIEIKDLQPIIINKEWLLDFGFKEIENKIGIFEKGRLRIWFGAKGRCLAYLIEEDTTNSHYIPCNLEYVNQLQNLYFALTGEELSYKK